MAAKPTTLEEESFSIYCDDDDDAPDRIFSVLDAPGPTTPYGALALSQAAIDAAVAMGEFDDLESGDSREEAGTVYYHPGSTDPDQLWGVTLGDITIRRE